jgi:serine/threonine-protein kinase HipA
MSKNCCLYCYKELSGEEIDFHSKCSKKIFGKPVPPILDYTNDQMLELAEKVIQSQSTVTGVQAKLSLGLENMTEKDKPQKLTIMGVWGRYILKPPSEHYPSLPELEDLTMHLAAIAGIRTVPHTLIRLKSGELSYITKRIDRKGKQKFHMEDMCQLTERLTESKYRGSYEQIGKALVHFSTNPGFDIINFFEQVVFCFLTGNNDMHLKNFSLFKDPKRGHNLSPAYDMVAAQLVVEGDSEELALTLNGRKRKITRKDFEVAMGRFEIDQKAFDNIFERFKKAIPKWNEFVEISFLPTKMKGAYQVMIDKKAKQLGL